MKLSGRTDIGASLDATFAFLTDFEGWERAALRRGADVTRTDKLKKPGPGMTWHVRFAWRGRERELQIRVVTLDAAGHLTLAFDGPSVEGQLNAELVAMAAKRTRLLMQVEIKPRTLPARLFIQSLKLAKTRVQKRFDGRLKQIATDVEARYGEAPAGGQA